MSFVRTTRILFSKIYLNGLLDEHYHYNIFAPYSLFTIITLSIQKCWV